MLSPIMALSLPFPEPLSSQSTVLVCERDWGESHLAVSAWPVPLFVLHPLRSAELPSAQCPFVHQRRAARMQSTQLVLRDREVIQATSLQGEQRQRWEGGGGHGDTCSWWRGQGRAHSSGFFLCPLLADLQGVLRTKETPSGLVTSSLAGC